MDIDPVLELLRERVVDPDYIPGLIKRLLIDNPHRVSLTLKPDLQLADTEQRAEQTKLAAIKESLSEDDSNAIVEQALALADRQSQEDDPNLLPKVGLEDVPAEITEPPREDSYLGGAGPQLSFYEQGTNGLSYQQIVFPLPALSSAELEVLPLYTSCLAEFGLGQKSYTEVQTWQSQVSGGVNVFNSIRSAQDDEQQLNGFLTFSSKSLAVNHGALTELLQATIESVRFDESQRLTELVEQICARKEASITGQGHSLAMNLACSRMSPGAQLTHQFGGLEGIRRLKAQREALAEESVRTDLLERMQKLHGILLDNPKRFLLIGEAERRDAMLNDLAECWGESKFNRRPASPLQPGFGQRAASGGLEHRNTGPLLRQGLPDSVLRSPR
jgi:Zn-dependent M16 (insulinase) family peptidase